MLTEDDPAQYASAATAVSSDFQLNATVMLETEWVLRSSYNWSRGQRVLGLLSVLDLPHAVAFPPYARWAIGQLAEGADFADMMHLATVEGASSFATFDRKLRRRAGPDAPVVIETLR